MFIQIELWITTEKLFGRDVIKYRGTEYYNVHVPLYDLSYLVILCHFLESPTPRH